MAFVTGSNWAELAHRRRYPMVDFGDGIAFEVQPGCIAVVVDGVYRTYIAAPEIVSLLRQSPEFTDRMVVAMRQVVPRA